MRNGKQSLQRKARKPQKVVDRSLGEIEPNMAMIKNLAPNTKNANMRIVGDYIVGIHGLTGASSECDAFPTLENMLSSKSTKINI